MNSTTAGPTYGFEQLWVGPSCSVIWALASMSYLLWCTGSTRFFDHFWQRVRTLRRWQKFPSPRRTARTCSKSGEGSKKSENRWALSPEPHDAWSIELWNKAGCGCLTITEVLSTAIIRQCQLFSCNRTVYPHLLRGSYHYSPFATCFFLIFIFSVSYRIIWKTKSAFRWGLAWPL